MTISRLLVHYGFHGGTTGTHFASACLAQEMGYPRPCVNGEHLSSALVRDCDSYLWIESSTCSYPLDIWNFPVPTAGYLIDSHLHPELSLLQAALFDIVFVAQRQFLPKVRIVNPNSHWLPLAAPSWFLTLPSIDRQYQIGFVGSLSQNASRRDLLLRLQREFITNDFSKQYSVQEMARVYTSSQCVVNPPVRDDLNMRFFEAMACGAAMVTPALNNGMDDLATRNEQFATADFTDPGAVSLTVDTLLRTGMAHGMGESARNLVRDRHTYEHRLASVVKVFDAASPKTASPIRSASPKDRARHMLMLAASIRDMRLMVSSTRGAGVDLKAPKAVTGAAVASARRSVREYGLHWRQPFVKSRRRRE